MEIYKDLSNQASKEFEKLLNSQLSKNKIEEGKVIDGKINKITEKFVFLFRSFNFSKILVKIIPKLQIIPTFLKSYQQ